VIRALKQHFFNQFNQWMKRRHLPGNPQYFNAKNVYIIPSSFGWAYAFVLFTLFCGAINYQISLVFLMVFLMALMGLGSAWQGQANLKGLTIKLLSIEDTYEGKPAQIHLLIFSQQKRFNLELEAAKQASVTLEKIETQALPCSLLLETNKRGYFTLPPLKISSVFPLGLFKVWGYVYFEEKYYVYPEPVNPDFWPGPVPSPLSNAQEPAGDDEVYDLKQVENPWAQPNLIAWKIAAKDQGWYVKTMSKPIGNYWLFKLDDLKEKNLEKKLRYLSYWLLTAEQQGDFYSLQLNNAPTKFGRGNQHLQRCLRQLAIY